MALLDRARSLTTAQPVGAGGWLRPDRRLAVGSGIVAAALSWLTVLVVCALAWGMSPQGTTGFAEVVGVASGAWFLATGGAVTVDGATVGVVPLGLWALAAWFTVRGWGRVRHTSERHLLTDARDFFLGYAAWVAIAGLASLLAPARPTMSSFITIWSVPAAALVVDLARHQHELDGLSWITDAWARGPEWARRAGRPVAHGLATLAAAATLVTVAAIVVRWTIISEITDAVAAGTMGDLVLVVVQLAYLPTLALWALSVVAGPGFQVAAEGSIALSGSHPGLLPLVPVLGAIPGEASYPTAAWALVLIPVAAGAALGRAAVREWSTVADWRSVLATIGVAAALVAGTIGALALLSSGPAGSLRLSWLGPHPGALTAYLWLELCAGGLLGLGWVALAARFRG